MTEAEADAVMGLLTLLMVAVLMGIGYMLGTTIKNADDARETEQTMYAPIAQKYAEQTLAYQRTLDDAVRGWRQCLHDLDTARDLNGR